MRFIFLIIIVILTAVVFLSLMSQRGSAKGLVDGKLAPLPSKPNCVSSEEGTDPSKKVEPLKADKTAIKAAIAETGGKLKTETDGYMAAIYTSGIMRFVDDVEFRKDGDVWQVRSASRVGYSDMGVNRKRVAALRDALS